MAANQSTLTDKLAEKAKQVTTTGDAGAKKPKTIMDLIKSMESEMSRALPKHITAERLTRIALTTVRLQPKLQQCNPQSLLGSLMLSAQLGLEPGPMGHCYLIPYGQECQFIIGYKGMIDLMWRSGQYLSLSVHEVCEKDEFDFEYGLEEKLRHKPALKDRGPAIGYYLVAKYKDGGHFVYFMSVEDVEKHRMRSSSVKNGRSSPWDTDYDAMARKTVIRAASRWMPMSIELQRQLSQDEAVKTEIAPDMTEIPNADVMDADFRVTDDDGAI
jgi:recombination protein RecT